VLADCLGHGGVNPLDLHLRPRGYRALAQIPRLTERQIASVVGAFDGLDSILRASLRELEACEGIAAAKARDIREGLRRLQEHNLMDRYLQL
jgi:diadenylate cyclase